MLQEFLCSASRVVIGKDEQFHLALCCFLSGGHLLLEDEPGMGKTTFAKVLARLFDLSFGRIQFTSDLLPADIIGVSIFDRDKQKFVFQPGPIFNQLVLGDELNRASPKTQSAFLQAMEEQAISIDGQTRELPAPFFFIATQNPRWSIGTFPLPESQLDRFMMKIKLGYPSRDAHMKILEHGNPAAALAELTPLWPSSTIRSAQAAVRAVHASEKIHRYVVDIAENSRQLPHSLSPRASLALLSCAKAYSYLDGRDFVAPEDVKKVASAVMNHRLISGDEFRSQVGLDRANQILQETVVPT